MSYDLIQFDGPESLAQTAATEWLEQLKSANKPNYCVALPGGRITRHLFSSVAKQIPADDIQLDSLHFFWGDERCVPPDDPESNFAMARELLFDPLKINARHIHRIRGEDDPQAAAAAAESELRGIAPENETGQPVLDLVFLGMGEDGHVASLFPGQPAEEKRTPAVYRAVTGPKPPPRRITLGYPALAVAREVWVLASGAGKEQALRQSLSVNATTPLGEVLALRPRTRIFSDIRL